MAGTLRIAGVLTLCLTLAHSSPAIPVHVSGHVYEGQVGDVIGRLAGVTMSLYASTSPWVLGIEVTATSTDSQGSYDLSLDDSGTYEFFTIVQGNEAGFSSVAATSIGGTVVSADRVRYDLGQLMTGATTNNDFYDKRENNPPVANDDQATTAMNTAVVMAVLANDSDPDGDPITITHVTDPSHGTANYDSETATYTPAAGFTGTDTFSYTIDDGRGGTDSAIVTMTVLASLLQKGEIRGIVVHDPNANGKFGAPESVLAGWMVFLDNNGNRIADRLEKKALTDASGRFVFTGLNPGAYRVDQVVRSGWKQVWPHNGLGQPVAWTISLASGQSVDVVFGEQPIAAPVDSNDSPTLLGFSLGQWAFEDPQKFNDRVRDNNFENPGNHQYDRIHVQPVKRLAPDGSGMMEMRNMRDLDPASATYGEMICARAAVPFEGHEGPRVLVRFAYLFEQPASGLELIVRLSDVPDLLDPTNRANARHYVPVGQVPPPPEGRPGSISSGRFGIFQGWVSTFPLDLGKAVYVELELVQTGGRTGAPSPSRDAIALASEGEGGSALVDDLAVEVHCDGICLDLNWSDTADEEDFLLVIASCGHSAGLVDAPMGSRYCLDGAFSSDGYIDALDVHSWDWTLRDPSRVACNYCRVPLPLADAGSETSGRLQSLSRSMNNLRPAGVGELTGDLLVLGKGRMKKTYSDILKDCYSLFDSDAVYRGNYAMTGLPNRCGVRIVRGSGNDVYAVDAESGVLRIDGRVETVIPAGRTSVAGEPRYGRPATVNVGIQGQGSASSGRPLLDVAFDGAGNAYVVPVVVQPAEAEPYVAAARLEMRQGSSPPYRVVQLYDDPPPPADNQYRNFLREIETDAAGNVYLVNVHALNESCILWKYGPDGTARRRVELTGPGSPAKIPDPVALHVSHDGGMLYLAPGQRGLQPSGSTVLYGLSTQDFSLVRSVTIQNMDQVTSVTEDPVSGCLWVTGVSMIDVPAYPSPMDDPFYVPFLAKIPRQAGTADATCIADPDHHDLALPTSVVWVGAGQ